MSRFKLSHLLYPFALVTAAIGFVLVTAGGLVTSTDSGLAVPDWPLSYGTMFPPMVGGIRFEHSHRVIAATVGLLTLLLSLALIFREKRRFVRWIGLTALGMVVLQGILGGMTVLLQLPPEISIAHACLGQTFFSTLVILAMILSPAWLNQRPAPGPEGQALFRTAAATTAAIFFQLALGASARHIGWLPPLIGAHIFWALAVAHFIFKTSKRTLQAHRANPLLRVPALLMPALLLVQLLLGTLTFLQGAAVLVATAHVAVGALLLASSAALTFCLYHVAVHPSLPAVSSGRPLKAYLELTKPRLTLLAVMTALLGYLWGSFAAVSAWKLFAVLAGTAFVGGGAGALNQWMERKADALMDRTRRRPLPAGLLPARSALRFGVALSCAGMLLLAWADPLAGMLAALTLASYLFLYTPMKSRSALCTLVGAIPGAIPPMIGWAVARGTLDLEAWILFSILFFWQLPHFLAIAWTYREDYARADFKMLPVVDPDGGATGRQIVLYCMALLPVSLLPAVTGSAGWLYFIGALLSGLFFLGFGIAAARSRSLVSAKRLFFASILYLPVILATMTLDKVI